MPHKFAMGEPKRISIIGSHARRNLVEGHHNGTLSQLCLCNTQSRYHAVFPFCVSSRIEADLELIFTAPSAKHVMTVPHSTSVQAQWLLQTNSSAEDLQSSW
jgi:hypothetical protein